MRPALRLILLNGYVADLIHIFFFFALFSYPFRKLFSLVPHFLSISSHFPRLFQRKALEMSRWITFIHCSLCCGSERFVIFERSKNVVTCDYQTQVIIAVQDYCINRKWQSVRYQLNSPIKRIWTRVIKRLHLQIVWSGTLISSTGESVLCNFALNRAKRQSEKPSTPSELRRRRRKC